MKDCEIRINYLYNSSFKIETKKHVLIFDYSNDKVEKAERNCRNGVIGLEDLETDKKIIVFASHSHGDHFSEIIFNWREHNPHIAYILSSDIKLKETCSNTNVMSVCEELILGDVSIKTFGSTDLGVSFLIKLEGITIFHAGDLNWWDWYDESPEDNFKMEKLFKVEVEKIRDEKIDLAFFPVDPRLRERYHLGPDHFIKEIRPSVLIPMHFREDFYITKEFADKHENESVRIIEIENRGEEFIIKI
jgi:L-ascorbate metabolism protein UlaG (beta-lactamase superfamily)